ncbi:hypothetical protein [Kitasatospora sp. NPDC017646]|uniref:hypothetical protein n=1 Tax=Kitasatospora sp. NPDC017646 TaxID=3364024 RepID=UPI0037BCEA64
MPDEQYAQWPQRHSEKKYTGAGTVDTTRGPDTLAAHAFGKTGALRDRPQPFEPRLNPHVDRARTHAAQWARHTGVPDEQYAQWPQRHSEKKYTGAGTVDTTRGPDTLAAHAFGKTGALRNRPQPCQRLLFPAPGGSSGHPGRRPRSRTQHPPPGPPRRARRAGRAGRLSRAPAFPRMTETVMENTT